MLQKSVMFEYRGWCWRCKEETDRTLGTVTGDSILVTGCNKCGSSDIYAVVLPGVPVVRPDEADRH